MTDAPGLAIGVLCGFLGAGFTFAPLVADVSHWFTARRGLAVGIAISGSRALDMARSVSSLSMPYFTSVAPGAACFSASAFAAASASARTTRVT